MAALQINADDLLTALRERNPQVESWLDRDSGDIYQISALFDDDEAEDDPTLFAAMRAQPQRFLRLPSTPASHGFLSMRQFHDSVADANLKGALAAALQRQRAFFHFQDVLVSAPMELARWQAFSRAQTLAWAVGWLQQQQITVEWLNVPGCSESAEQARPAEKGST